MGLADLCVDVVLEFLRYLSLEELLSLRMVCRMLCLSCTVWSILAGLEILRQFVYRLSE